MFQYDGRCGAVKRAADKMFTMSWIATIGPRPDDLWVIGKDNLVTLALLLQCPLEDEILSHLN